jgi:uncharacterized protein (DUF1697 family)
LRYVALLRGINVGGHRMVKKEELADIFASAGLTDVVTLLASGNVVFSSNETDEAALQSVIEGALNDSLGYHVDVMVRTIAYMKELVALDPFADYTTEGAKFYVTFMARKPETVPPLPEDLPGQQSVAVGANDREFFAVSRKVQGSYGDFSPFMKAAFGKQPMTTRNWNTVVKLAAFGD